MTEVEPEFNDAERDDWYSLWEYEQTLCPQCGGPRDECESPDVGWYPQRHKCWKTAAQQTATRKFTDKHAKSQPDLAGYLPTDGSLVWVATEDLSPEDDFL